MDPPDGRIAQRTPFSSIAAELPVRLMCKQLPNACHYLARCKNLISILQSVSQIPFNASTFHVLQSSVVHTLADLLTQDCQLAIGHGQPLPYFPTVCLLQDAFLFTLKRSSVTQAGPSPYLSCTPMNVSLTSSCTCFGTAGAAQVLQT